MNKNIVTLLVLRASFCLVNFAHLLFYSRNKIRYSSTKFLSKYYKSSKCGLSVNQTINFCLKKKSRKSQNYENTDA